MGDRKMSKSLKKRKVRFLLAKKRLKAGIKKHLYIKKSVPIELKKWLKGIWATRPH